MKAFYQKREPQRHRDTDKQEEKMKNEEQGTENGE